MSRDPAANAALTKECPIPKSAKSSAISVQNDVRNQRREDIFLYVPCCSLSSLTIVSPIGLACPPECFAKSVARPEISHQEAGGSFLWTLEITITDKEEPRRIIRELSFSNWCLRCERGPQLVAVGKVGFDKINKRKRQ
jgi:hypothetical protein